MAGKFIITLRQERRDGVVLELTPRLDQRPPAFVKDIPDEIEMVMLGVLAWGTYEGPLNLDADITDYYKKTCHWSYSGVLRQLTFWDLSGVWTSGEQYAKKYALRAALILRPAGWDTKSVFPIEAGGTGFDPQKEGRGTIYDPTRIGNLTNIDGGRVTWSSAH